MATREQREALLAETCGWCGSGPNVECRARNGARISTLDGGAHDARWKTALGIHAPVISGAVRDRVPVNEDREPVLVGAGSGVDGGLAGGFERPW